MNNKEITIRVSRRIKLVTDTRKINVKIASGKALFIEGDISDRVRIHLAFPDGTGEGYSLTAGELTTIGRCGDRALVGIIKEDNELYLKEFIRVD